MTPVCAETAEVATLATSESTVVMNKDFLQEFDIIFWQTMPFMAFWGYFVDHQVAIQTAAAGAPHWDSILAFTVLVSTANAYFHAQRVVTNERTRNNH